MKKSLLLAMVLVCCSTLAYGMDTWQGPGFYTGGGSSNVEYFTTNPSGHNGSVFLGSTLGGGSNPVTINNNPTQNATATTGPIENNNRNTNTAFGGSSYVNSENKNYNSNFQGQGQDQKQKQGQTQGQSQQNTFTPTNSQSQSSNVVVAPTNNQSQAVNNGQTISPSQSTSVNIEAPKIPAGLGRDFADPQGLPFTQFVPPAAPGDGVLLFDPRALPQVLTYAQAEKLMGKGKAQVYMTISEPNYRMDIIRATGRIEGELLGFAVGTSKASVAEAWGAAMKMGMEYGGDKVVLVKAALHTDKPSSFFIGLGSSYTHAELSGSEKDGANTVGGSGLIGYSKSFTDKMVSVVLAIYRTPVAKENIKRQVK